MDSNKRLQVILNSTYIEQEVSKILCLLLEVDLDQSKMLGHKSGAFTFNQKIGLLTDLDTFDKVEFPKFQTFMEIRNQFAHNFSVNDFTTCCQYAKNVQGILIKYKVDPPLPTKEEELTDQYTQLFQDVFRVVNEVWKKSLARMIHVGVQKKLPQLYEEILLDVRDYAKNNKDFEPVFNTIIDKYVGEAKKSNENNST